MYFRAIYFLLATAVIIILTSVAFISYIAIRAGGPPIDDYHQFHNMDKNNDTIQRVQTYNNKPIIRNAVNSIF